MRRFFWFPLGLGLVGVAVVVLALPTAIEGPTLLRISPGHALSVVDAVALIPLLLGCVLLYGGLWRGRGKLASVWSRRPKTGAAVIFACGLGSGLLIASAFSAFFWWWAIGAALVGATVVAAAAVVWGGSGGR